MSLARIASVARRTSTATLKRPQFVLARFGPLRNASTSSNIMEGQPQQRWFSAEAVAQKEDGETTRNPTPIEKLEFSTPRVKALYERMIQLNEDEVAMVGDLVLEILDLPWEENEFYYHGIGKYGGGGGGKGAAEAAVEEVKKDTFDLKLVGFDDKSKIKVIKEVRSLAGLGLKEAKEMVESAPKILQKDLKPEAAEELKAKLEAVGAQVELV